MSFQIPIIDILSPVEETDDKNKGQRKNPFMQRLALRLDLGVFDLWLIVFTIIGLVAIYGIGELAAILTG